MKKMLKRALAMLCVLMLVVSEVPASAAETLNAKSAENATAESSDNGILVVKTQKELEAALKSGKVTGGEPVTIRIETSKAVTFTIPSKDLSNVVVCVDAPKATIKNKAVLDRMAVYDAKSYTEYAQNNSIKVYDSKLTIKTDKAAVISELTISNSKSKITLTNNGVIDKAVVAKKSDLTITQKNKINSIELKKPANIVLSGSSKNVTDIIVSEGAQGSEIKTSVPSDIDLYAEASVRFEAGSKKNNSSRITLKKDNIGYSVENASGKVVTIFEADGSETYARKNQSIEKEAPVSVPETVVPAGAPEEKTESKDDTKSETAKTEERQTGTPSSGGSQPYAPVVPARTTYFELSFAAGEDLDAEGLTLPEARTVEEGTMIGSLPLPSKANAIFLGWYYDPACTDAVTERDGIVRNTTVYAKMAETEGVVEEETPNYVTVNVPADAVSSYSFGIRNYVSGDVTFENVSSENEAVLFSVGEDGRVSAALEQGKTYSVTIADEAPDVFVINGEAQPESIRVFNIITEKDETQNLTLTGGMIYIPASEVTDMSGTALDGLFTVSTAANTITENTYDGAFTYSGAVLNVDDKIAIYAGTRPDLRDKDTDNGAVAYVTVTGRSGSRYTYQSSDAVDVLFIPDIIPVLASEDLDGDRNNNSITVDRDVFDFASGAYEEFGLNADTTLDRGDYIVLYEGDPEEPSWYQYVVITSVTEGDSTYIIAYDLSSEEEMSASMDIYSSRNEEIELSESEIEQIQNEMERQALASGFVDEAAEYLTALALETDGFKELSDDLDLDLSSYRISFADGRELQPGDVELMAGSNARITKMTVQAAVVPGKSLQHFEGKSGVRAELSVKFEVEVGDKIEITLQAVFEQEIMLSLNVSGGAIKKKVWAFIYKIEDYEMSANIDVGTYTGIGITATACTKDGDDDDDDKFDWKNVSGSKAEQKILDIGKQITDLMNAKDRFLGKELVDQDGKKAEWAGTQGGGLAEKYANFMEEAEESWIEILRVKIFKAEGSVDPLHVLCYGVSADFVVKANLYVTMGMTFSYSNAKRYSFSFKLLAKTSSQKTVDIEESNYNFDFYVFGTLGLRAGIELEVGVGLFSLSLDSIGIVAEVGAYAQLWGYFYYHCSWSQSKGKTSGCSGALLIEVGAYLEISFKAQLFSSSKLTYMPTLYSNSWPFLQIGQRENVYEFAEITEDSKGMDIKSAKSFSLPANAFDMNYLELNTGELYGSDADNPRKNPALSLYSDRANRFTVSVSNPKFSYNIANNTVTVNPAGSIIEDCTITITYKGGSLAFTSKPIQREINIHWTDEAGARFIQFNTNGGTSVDMVRTGVGGAIGSIAVPTKTGYTFGGWYTDTSFRTAYSVPATMPNYNTSAGKGIVVYAKWNPATNTKYVVEHYKQKQNGTYELSMTEQKSGTTDAFTVETAKSTGEYANYTAKNFEQQKIAPNGSTVVKIYYNLRSYTVAFDFGAQADGTVNTAPVSVTEKYGKSVFVPVFAKAGYVFAGFVDAAGRALNYDTDTRSIPVTGDASYSAVWTLANDTGYKIERYGETASGDFILLSGNGLILGQGTTNSVIDIYASSLSIDGMEFIEAKVGDQVTTAPTIAADGSTVVKMYYRWIDIPYTVEYYCEKANEDGYELYEYETLSAITGATVTAAAKSYSHMNLNTSAAGTVASAVITTDSVGENAVTLKLYYDRERVTVDFFANGGVIADGEETGEFKYGQMFSANDPTKAQHLFDGWYDENSNRYTEQTAVTGDVTLTAVWREDKVDFVVKHYVMDTNGDYPAAPTDEDSINEFRGAEITLSDLCDSTYFCEGGIAYDCAKIGSSDESAATAEVQDGLIVRIYYKRLKHELITMIYDENEADYVVEGTPAEFYYEETINYPTLRRDGFSISTTDDTPVTMGTESVVVRYDLTPISYELVLNCTGGSTTERILVAYGDTITRPGTDPTKQGYVFDKWYTDVDRTVECLFTETMPIGGMTLFAGWDPAENTAYAVEHYRQNASGTGYELYETEHLTGTTDNLAGAVAKSYTGFNLNSLAPGTVAYAGIAPDGSTVLKLYYDREVVILEGELTISGPDCVIYNYSSVYSLIVGSTTVPAQNVLWESSDNSVLANMSDGAFFGKVRRGDATITATYEGRTVTKEVKVRDYEQKFADKVRASGSAELEWSNLIEVEVEYLGTGSITLDLIGATMYWFKLYAPNASKVVIDGLDGTGYNTTLRDNRSDALGYNADLDGLFSVDAPNALVNITGISCKKMEVNCSSFIMENCEQNDSDTVVVKLNGSNTTYELGSTSQGSGGTATPIPVHRLGGN